MLNLASMIELHNATAIIATIPLQTYLTAVHYVLFSPLRTGPKRSAFVDRVTFYTRNANVLFSLLIMNWTP